MGALAGLGGIAGIGESLLPSFTGGEGEDGAILAGVERGAEGVWEGREGGEGEGCGIWGQWYEALGVEGYGVVLGIG